MEYPGSKFTRRYRLILFAVFVAAFFVITPVLIMYSSGYRYDWQNGLIKETGAINVDILPVNAVVYLNDAWLKGGMPYRLKNIAPGKYRLKITAPGYFDWLKDVEVKSKQTVYIKEISLLKKNTPYLLAPGQIKNAALAADGNFIIFSRQKTVLEFWLRDLTQQKETLLLELPPGKPLTIVWAKKNNYAVISEAEPPYKTLIIINTVNPGKQINLTQKSKEPILKYEWKQSVEPELFFGVKNKFYSLLPRRGQVYNIAKNTWRDWTMENSQLWVLRKNDTGGIELVNDLLGFNSIFTPAPNTENIILDDTYNLIAAKNNEVLLHKKNTSEMLLLASQNTYKINGEKFLISPYNDWWLIWTPWELTTYSQSEEPYLLNRSGEQLKEAMPLDKSNTLGLVWENRVTVLFPYYLVSHNLIDQPITAATADSERRIFYFGAKINNEEGLWQLTY